MPMEKETVAELTAQCRKAMKKPMKFAYFPSGPDGEPVLVIDKNIGPKLKELKKTAQKKKFSTGTVQKGEKGLEFLPEKDPGKLKQHLKNVFAKQIALLKSATIVMDAAVETEESDAEETQAAPTAPSTPSPQPAPAPPASQQDGEQAGPISAKKLEKFTSALAGPRPGSIPHDQLVQLQQQLASNPQLGDAALRNQVAAEMQRREKLVARQESLAKGLASIRELYAKLEAEMANSTVSPETLAKTQKQLPKLKERLEQFRAELR